MNNLKPKADKESIITKLLKILSGKNKEYRIISQKGCDLADE